MKREYTAPEISIMVFDNEDIITTSSIMDNIVGSDAAEDLYFSTIFGIK